MEQKLDIIIFGATGFTGKHAIPVMSKFANTKYGQFAWGIAGRSEKKLRKILVECERDTGASLDDIPIIIANVEDEKSLKEMARKARVIINCCGPYRLYGEPVVKACVEEGTHHVDVSGEPHYMERVQQKFHSLAQEKGVYVISSCGVDSIPSDLGVVFLQQKFKGTLNSVVTYLDSWQEGKAIPGSTFNYSTWESAVHGLSQAEELNALRRQMFPTPLPSLKPKLKSKTLPHKSDLVQGWAVPFPGADRSVIKRSQRSFYENEFKRPIQIETYYVFKSLDQVQMAAFYGWLFAKLAKHQYGRDLLLKYPEQLSNGVVTWEPPNEARIENTLFCLTLYGEGWKETLPDANDEYTIPPNRAISAKVTGRNPAYGATCVCVVLAAITMLTDMDKMPAGGGVYAPGYGFAKTSLIERLNDNGVNFEIVFEKDLPTSKY